MQEHSLLRRYYCGGKYKLDSVDPEVNFDPCLVILSMIETFQSVGASVLSNSPFPLALPDKKTIIRLLVQI